MKQIKVLGVSFGSSKRDKIVDLEIAGIRACVERKGVDGSKAKAREIFLERQNTVDAFGIGGTDLYFVLDERIYAQKDTARLVAGIVTPSVDGIGIKMTREPQLIKDMASEDFERRYGFTIRGKRVFVACAIDRYLMTKELSAICSELIIGDIMLNFNLPISLKSLGAVKRLGVCLLPIITHFPIERFYPIGQEQTKNTPRFSKYFKNADVIAGDFHYIRKYAPNDLEGKIIITNTTTEDDVVFLRERGVYHLTTSTPVINGRSFGTNVLEAIVVAILGKETNETHPSLGYADYLKVLEYKELQPTFRDIRQ